MDSPFNLFWNLETGLGAGRERVYAREEMVSFSL
jgi:hypothetical protein